MSQRHRNVVQLSNYSESQTQSQYERYPLPFFSGESRSTWAVQPTGNYGEDCEKGKAYAIAFLKSRDGTVGWSALLQNIVADMIRAGSSGTFADGHPKVDGVVIGFMGVIGQVLVQAQ